MFMCTGNVGKDNLSTGIHRGITVDFLAGMFMKYLDKSSDSNQHFSFVGAYPHPDEYHNVNN